MQHLGECRFLNVEAEARHYAVAHIEIAADADTNGLFGMLPRNLHHGRHLRIVVEVHDAASQNDLSCGVCILYGAVEVDLLHGHAHPFGNFQFHVAHHLGIAPHVFNHATQPWRVVRLVGIGYMGFGIVFPECRQKFMVIQSELLRVEQIECIAMTAADILYYVVVQFHRYLAIISL